MNKQVFLNNRYLWIDLYFFDNYLIVKKQSYLILLINVLNAS